MTFLILVFAAKRAQKVNMLGLKPVTFLILVFAAKRAQKVNMLGLKPVTFLSRVRSKTCPES